MRSMTLLAYKSMEGSLEEVFYFLTVDDFMGLFNLETRACIPPDQQWLRICILPAKEDVGSWYELAIVDNLWWSLQTFFFRWFLSGCT